MDSLLSVLTIADLVSPCFRGTFKSVDLAGLNCNRQSEYGHAARRSQRIGVILVVVVKVLTSHVQSRRHSLFAGPRPASLGPKNFPKLMAYCDYARRTKTTQQTSSMLNQHMPQSLGFALNRTRRCFEPSRAKSRCTAYLPRQLVDLVG